MCHVAVSSCQKTTKCSSDSIFQASILTHIFNANVTMGGKQQQQHTFLRSPFL